MTVTSVTLADIQQTLAQLQEAAGTTAIGAGTAAGSADTGFAADFDSGNEFTVGSRAGRRPPRRRGHGERRVG